MLKEKFIKFLTSLKIAFKQAGEQIEKSLNELTDDRCDAAKISLFDKIVSKLKSKK